MKRGPSGGSPPNSHWHLHFAFPFPRVIVTVRTSRPRLACALSAWRLQKQKPAAIPPRRPRSPLTAGGMIPFNPAVAAEVRALIQGAEDSTFDPIYRELSQVILQHQLPTPTVDKLSVLR